MRRKGKGKSYPNNKGKNNKQWQDHRKDDRKGEYSNRSDKQEDKSMSPLNDFSWYNRNPNLTYAASRIPFPFRPGMKMPTLTWLDTSTSSQLEYEVPGFLTLHWIPTVGSSLTPTDPASIVGKEIYARVRKVFSGSIDADAPDFVIYLIALDSIFSYIGALKRIYRILDTYTPYNYYIPDKLLEEFGFSATAIVALKQSRMQLYQNINELISMTSKFKCPAVFDYFNRHYWMNDNVYCDAPSPNSQMFLFVQDAYYKFMMLPVIGTTPTITAGGCSMVDDPFSNASSVDDLFSFGRSLIDALAGSDDAYLISGYLMRAFEGETEFKVDPLTLDEKFTPVYVPEVLAQIENSQTVYQYAPSNSGVNGVSKTNSVWQDPSTNTVKCSPSITAPAASNLPSWLSHSNGDVCWMSLRTDTPTEEDVVVASRLIAKVKPLSANTISAGDVLPIICGTEIPLRWTLNTTDSTNVTMSINQVQELIQTETLTATTFRQLMAAFRISNYDWAPFVMMVGYSAASTPFISTWFLGDTHNITQVSRSALENLHRICLYSEFNSFGIDA